LRIFRILARCVKIRWIGSWCGSVGERGMIESAVEMVVGGWMEGRGEEWGGVEGGTRELG